MPNAHDLTRRMAVPPVLAVAIAALGALAAATADASLVAPSPEHSREARFYSQLDALMLSLAGSDEPLIRELHAAVTGARRTIRIVPITDDRSTWHEDGNRNRGHTDPADGKRKSKGRDRPTDAIVYLTREGVEPGARQYLNGLLVHELVHALDLVEGRYNRSDRIRERRATFLQNVWRKRTGFRLREDYHGRFPTLDYQEAARTGAIDRYARYIFTRDDFPVPAEAVAVRPSSGNSARVFEGSRDGMSKRKTTRDNDDD